MGLSRAAKGAVLLLVALGSTAVLVRQTTVAAPLAFDNRATFYSLSDGIEPYREFKVAWRPRIASTYLAARTVQLAKFLTPPNAGEEIELQYTIALWTGLWSILICGIYLAAFRDQGVFLYWLATAMALLYGYIPDLFRTEWWNLPRVYPWDLPATAVFAAFLVLWIRRQYAWIVVLVALGTGFKETSLVLCLAFLACDLPWRKRLQLFALSFAAGVAVKLAIDLYTQVPVPFFTVEHGYAPANPGALYLRKNIATFLDRPLLLLLANAGTLLAFLILPSANRDVRCFKLVAVAFVCGNLLFGLIAEVRIFFEMIPLSLYSIFGYSLGRRSPGTTKAYGERSSRL